MPHPESRAGKWLIWIPDPTESEPVPSLQYLLIGQGHRCSILALATTAHCYLLICRMADRVYIMSDGHAGGSCVASLCLLTSQHRCAVFIIVNHLPTQPVRVSRRAGEGDDSESFVTQKMLLYKQARFPKRYGMQQVRSLCPLAFDESV